MARSVNTDYLHNMRFHVTIAGTDTDDKLGVSPISGGKPRAGFMSVDMPTMTVESVAYKEGIWVYSKKFPGNPSFQPITMARGVTRKDTKFYEWLKQTAEGNGNYRVDLIIHQLHREVNLNNTSDVTANLKGSDPASMLTGMPDNYGRRVYLYNAFPTQVVIGSALSGDSADVSVTSIQIEYENIGIETPSISAGGQ